MLELPSVIVLAHLVSTLFMVGMIWTVQLVHYPLMALVGPERFQAYEAAHSPRMAAVVMFPWAIQGITVAAMLITAPEGVPVLLIRAAAAAAAVPVLVTVIASIPAHARLADGYDRDAHRTLVRTNWIRTAGWTIHGVLAVWIAVRAG